MQVEGSVGDTEVIQKKRKNEGNATNISQIISYTASSPNSSHQDTIELKSSLQQPTAYPKGQAEQSKTCTNQLETENASAPNDSLEKHIGNLSSEPDEQLVSKIETTSNSSAMNNPAHESANVNNIETNNNSSNTTSNENLSTNLTNNNHNNNNNNNSNDNNDNNNIHNSRDVTSKFIENQSTNTRKTGEIIDSAENAQEQTSEASPQDLSEQKGHKAKSKYSAMLGDTLKKVEREKHIEFLSHIKEFALQKIKARETREAEKKSNKPRKSRKFDPCPPPDFIPVIKEPKRRRQKKDLTSTKIAKESATSSKTRETSAPKTKKKDFKEKGDNKKEKKKERKKDKSRYKQLKTRNVAPWQLDISEQLELLRDPHSLMATIELKDIVNLKNWSEQLSVKEQKSLQTQFLPPSDHARMSSLFSSPYFSHSLHVFQDMLLMGRFESDDDTDDDDDDF